MLLPSEASDAISPGERHFTERTGVGQKILLNCLLSREELSLEDTDNKWEECQLEILAHSYGNMSTPAKLLSSEHAVLVLSLLNKLSFRDCIL